MRTIYFDYNATTPVDPQVRAAMQPFLDEVWGNPSSIHHVGRRARSLLDDFRDRAARFLGAKPSEIIRRQFRVTPYPHEDTGWIIANSGPEICLFSSDYPHVEGGRHPLKRFDESIAKAGLDDAAIQAFYFDNFVDLMGDVLVRAGLPTDARQAVAA